MWELTEDDLQSIAIGAGILGTGGGLTEWLTYIHIAIVVCKFLRWLRLST